jgi:DNA-binding ferritin-like protein (Dps family)
MWVYIIKVLYYQCGREWGMSQQKKLEREYEKAFGDAIDFFELALTQTKFVGPVTRERIHTTIRTLLMEAKKFDEQKH